MASAATPSSLPRADRLLDEEIAQLRARRGSLPPAAVEAVRTVLASIAADEHVDRAVAADASSLYDGLARPSQQQSTAPGPPRLQLSAV
jgi:hypothetical protein